MSDADRNMLKLRRSDGGSQQIGRKKTKQTSVTNLRQKNDKMLANFRLKRSTKASRAKSMVNKVNRMAKKITPIVSGDKMSHKTGLLNLKDLLSELKTEDSQLGPLRKCILAREREGYMRLGN